MTCLAARGLAVDLQILYNKASVAYKEAITFKWNVNFQLVPPNMHPQNRAECAICKFKDHFLVILACVDSAFPPYLWDLLLSQAELTLNLLRQATLNPRTSAWDFFQGPFDFNKTPLGCSSVSHPHPCKASYLEIFGLPRKTRLLCWPCPRFLPLLQVSQVRHQEPSHLGYRQILPFVPLHPCAFCQR
jgi:hypothetical protein